MNQTGQSPGQTGNVPAAGVSPIPGAPQTPPSAILPTQPVGTGGQIHRGYYTVARRYEFYVRLARTISRPFAALTREILFLPREHKIHVFELTCNVLFVI